MPPSPISSNSKRQREFILVPTKVCPSDLSVASSDEEIKKLTTAMIKLLSEQGFRRNFEVLSGYPDIKVYRIDEKARLLLVLCLWQGKKAWCAVEAHWEHHYDESKCLQLSMRGRAAMVAKYLNACLPYCLAPEGDRLIKAEEAQAVKASTWVQHAQRYIPLTEQQENFLSSLKETRPINIIAGQPGSGKSTLLMETLRHLGSLSVSDPILCTVPSRPLQSALHQEWLSQGIYPTETDPVKIFTEEDLLKYLYPQTLQTLSPKNHATFISWAEASNLPIEQYDAVDVFQVYQELCVINALRVKALHQKNQSLILAWYTSEPLRQAFLCTSKEKREQLGKDLLALLRAYETHLAGQGAFDARLFCPTEPITSDQRFYLLTDETQNLAPSTLITLLHLNRERFMIFMNDSQGMALRARLNEILILNDRELVGDAIKHIRHLDGSHRSPANIVELAQVVEGLKSQINPDAKYATTSCKTTACNPAKGELFWGESKYFETLNPLFTTGTAAIILLGECHPETIQIIKTQYPKTPVFDADNFPEGLEFKDVILMNPFDHRLDSPLSHALREKSPGAKRKPSDDLNPNQKEYYRQRLSRLVAAVTRSTDRLIVIQDDVHQIQHLIDSLRGKDRFIPLNTLKNPLSSEALSESELYDLALDRYRAGYLELARELIRTLPTERQEQFEQEIRPVVVPPEQIEVQPQQKSRESDEPKSTKPLQGLSLDPNALKALSSLSKNRSKSSPADIQKTLGSLFDSPENISRFVSQLQTDDQFVTYFLSEPMSCIGRGESYFESICRLRQCRISKENITIILSNIARQEQLQSFLDAFLKATHPSVTLTIGTSQEILKLLVSTRANITIESEMLRSLIAKFSQTSIPSFSVTETGLLSYFISSRLRVLSRLKSQCLHISKCSGRGLVTGYFTPDELDWIEKTVGGVTPIRSFDDKRNSAITKFQRIFQEKNSLVLRILKNEVKISEQTAIEVLSFFRTFHPSFYWSKVNEDQNLRHLYMNNLLLSAQRIEYAMCSDFFLGENAFALTTSDFDKTLYDGQTVAYHLMSTIPGRHFLWQRPELFESLKQTNLNHAIAKDAPSALSFFFITPMGYHLLLLHWSELKIFLTKEEIHRQWIHEGRLTSIANLMLNMKTSFSFLMKYWYELYRLFDLNTFGFTNSAGTYVEYDWVKNTRSLFTESGKDFTKHFSEIKAHSNALQLIDDHSDLDLCSTRDIQLYLKALFFEPSVENMRRFMQQPFKDVYHYLCGPVPMCYIGQTSNFMKALVFVEHRPFLNFSLAEFEAFKSFIQSSQIDSIRTLASKGSLFLKSELLLIRDLVQNYLKSPKVEADESLLSFSLKIGCTLENESHTYALDLNEAEWDCFNMVIDDFLMDIRQIEHLISSELDIPHQDILSDPIKFNVLCSISSLVDEAMQEIFLKLIANVNYPYFDVIDVNQVLNNPNNGFCGLKAQYLM